LEGEIAIKGSRGIMMTRENEALGEEPIPAEMPHGLSSNKLQIFAVRNRRTTNPSLSQDLILSNIPSTY